MRRGKWILSSLAAVCLVVGLIVWRTSGQDPVKPSKTEASLPIRQVVLFNSGVSYLQREGEVDDDARVDLSFPAGDINDLLKSMILQDLSGGRIDSVNYDSHDPIDKILRSFAVDLNNNPTLGQILNQVRGEKIEITRRAGSVSDRSTTANDRSTSNEKPVRQVGTIIGMEVKKQPGKDGSVEVEYLNLSGEGGLTSIAMEQVQSVRFLNPVLESEFQRALRVLAGAHDASKKTVSLGFSGQGRRSVKVGYVIEHPIWKTSYRLRIDPNGRVFIQGWAIVENTSDDDWTDVRMVLVSGRPISYKMNMYEPLYIPRPEVEPELFASLRPQVHGGAMVVPINAGGVDFTTTPPPRGSSRAAGAPGGVNALSGGTLDSAQAPPPNLVSVPYDDLVLGYGSASNAPYPGKVGKIYVPSSDYDTRDAYPRVHVKEAALARSNLFESQGPEKVSYDELQRRRQAQVQQQAKAKREGAAIAGLNFKEGIASVASAEEAGDFYQYVLDQKITLPRQKSAMLPILDQTIAGSKVSIFNAATHAKYPLLGLKLKNSSKLHLSQGPITVYEDGSYAGDTRILDLQPGEERFLSYALDQAVEVKSDVKTTPSPDMNFVIGGDTLTANYKMRKTRTYVVRNRAAKDRTVILEHPIQEGQPSFSAETMVSEAGKGPATVTAHYQPVSAVVPQVKDGTAWKLIKPQKPLETTRDHYRFQVVVPAGKAVNFDVVEEQDCAWRLALNVNGEQVAQTGIQVKAQTVATPDRLLSVKIDKGLVIPTWKSRVSKTYFVQNHSDIDRNFTVDHLTRADWVRLDDKEVAHKGPATFRFVLPVEKGKTAQREVIEELTREDSGTLVRSLSEATIRQYLASPVPTAEVKAVFTKFLAMNAKIAETQKQLQEQGEQLRQLSDDQARLRENLKIIPQSSEPYKKFLEKFVAQEGEIEGYQKQLRQLQTTLQQQQREMDAAFSSSALIAPPPLGLSGPPTGFSNPFSVVQP